MEGLAILIVVNSGIITFFLWRIGSLVEDLLEHQQKQLPQVEPTRLSHTTINPVVQPFTATTAMPVSEESIKIATARMTEELRARGTNATPEQIRAHVLELLGS